MSFGFTVAGDRDQTVKQLEAIRDDENQESLRNGIAALLAEHVNLSELHGYNSDGTGWRQVYVIRVSGHSGPESALSLNVSVETPYVPVPGSAQPEPETAATDVVEAEIVSDED